MLTATKSNIDCIFHPKSVAIVGASKREGSFGHLFLNGILQMGFTEVYPVHPRDSEMMGLKTYPGVKEIPFSVDLAILIVPPGEALKVVQECTDKGVKGIILFTSGFGEKGEEGKKVEQQISSIVRKSGTRLIGPNTNGVYSPTSRLLTLPGCLMSGGLTSESGNLSIFSQSGSFNDFMCQTLSRKNIRFNTTVSCGNECDLTAVDFLEYFGNDQGTGIIAGYLEGIKDGRRFYELAKDISQRKPIVIWKGGLTETGARAAAAHTGALAGSRQVWETMFKQAGIVSVGSFEEAVDCVLAFSWLPLPAGRRIAIISNMGGTNIGTTDNCIKYGLEIARLGEVTRERLSQLLPSVGTSVANPLDMGVQTLLNQNVYGEAIKIIGNDPGVDMLLVIADPDLPMGVQSIANTAKAINKPCAVALFDIPGLSGPQYELFLEKQIPTYYEAKRAAQALSRLCNYAEFRRSGS
jgi:acetate---CoA ligase (ADP-forming)